MSYALPSRQLVSQEDSSMVERPDVPRSTFVNQWSRKTTFDAGLLIPIVVDEIFPGDQVRYDATCYVRMATPITPVMDNQRLDTHWFFVPYRLCWPNWVKLMGEQDNPADSIAFTVPKCISTGNGFAVGSTGDHFGLPTIGQALAQLQVSALPFRAYNLIYNDWFRDQNLINSAFSAFGDSANFEADFPIRRRAKSHDYFTSCLPWPQKFTAPTVPVGGLAPIVGLGFQTTATGGAATDVKETGNPITQNYAVGRQASVAASVIIESTGALANAQPMVYADLALATGVSINVLRQSFLIQQLLERDARGGTRYTEIMRSHFGVKSPDSRLQQPEYIGGGSSPIGITPIAQTATGGSGLGTIGGAGTAYGQHKATYSATEHGVIIGLMSVRTELSYSQGIHKMWDRSTRYDFPFPSLMGLGEQAVLRREIFATGQAANDDVVFGYQERWHECRTRYSEVTARFRPTATPNIDEWIFTQQFSGAPVLGQTFIEDSPPMARVLAAGASADGQQFFGDIMFNRTITRCMSMYGTPVALGRF